MIEEYPPEPVPDVVANETLFQKMSFQLQD